MLSAACMIQNECGHTGSAIREAEAAELRREQRQGQGAETAGRMVAEAGNAHKETAEEAETGRAIAEADIVHRETAGEAATAGHMAAEAGTADRMAVAGTEAAGPGEGEDPVANTAAARRSCGCGLRPEQLRSGRRAFLLSSALRPSSSRSCPGTS